MNNLHAILYVLNRVVEGHDERENAAALLKAIAAPELPNVHLRLNNAELAEAIAAAASRTREEVVEIGICIFRALLDEQVKRAQREAG